MNDRLYLLLVFSLSFVSCSFYGNLPPNIDLLGGGPVIGILAQDADFEPYAGSHNYIASSYIKWIEQTSSRVVPVDYQSSFEEIEELMRQLNGFLLPGGDTELFESVNGTLVPTYYQEVVGFILETAKNINDEGTYYPVWGTCMGFQNMFIALGGQNVSLLCSGCFNGSNQTAPITLLPGASDSRLLKGVPKDLISYVLTENALTWSHHDGFNLSAYYSNPIIFNNVNLLATSYDKSDNEFVGIIEHKSYPFYGVQFHPEKAQFEWLSRININHDIRSSWFSTYLAYFFGSEARKNENLFKSVFKLQRALILNFLPIRVYNTFDTNYVFSKSLSSLFGKNEK